MKKRILAAGLSIMVAATLLTGCGGSESSSTGSDGGTQNADENEAAQGTESSGGESSGDTLRISWWGNQTRNDGTVAAIELYESLHPEVKIQYEFSDWSGYWDKMSTQAAGGTMPDIVQHDYSYLKQYVSSSQLLNLTPYMEDGTLDLSNVVDSVLESGTVDGQLYGLCLGTNAPMMIYDKAVTDEAGVTISEQMTVDELYDIGKTIYEATGTKTYFDGWMTMITMAARADGKDIFDTILEGDNQYAKAHFENVKKFADAEWCLSPDLIAEKDPDIVETKPIIDGTTWNDFSFSNQFIAISDAAGREFEITMYPTFSGAAQQVMYLKPGMFFSVAETSDKKDEAIAFLNWFTNDVECNKILLAERGIPISSDVADAVREEVDEKTTKVFDYIAKVEETATSINPPSPTGAGEVEAYLKNVVEQIRYGQDVDEATEEFMAQAKKILEESDK